MKRLSAVFVLILSVSSSQGGEASSDASAGDLARLQGRWSARAGSRRELQVLLEVQGKEIRVAITTPQGLDIKVRGGMKLDEAVTPRNIDWINLAGPDQQPLPQIAAIYKLEGDTFTVCNGGFLGSRPAEFKGGDGPLADVVVFRRLNEDSTNRSGIQQARQNDGVGVATDRAATAESVRNR